MRFQQICFSVRIPELLGPMFCMRLSESGSFVLPAQAFCLQIEGSFPTFHTQGPTVTLHCGRIPMISNSYTWLVLAIRGSYITGKRRQEGILRSGPRIVQGPGPSKSPQRGPPRDCGWQLACPPRSASQWGSRLSNGTHPRIQEPYHQSFTDPS